MKKLIWLSAKLVNANISVVYFILLVIIPSLSTSVCNAESNAMPKLWPGYAILGNGKLCAVYSDDPRVHPKSTLQGIQHLYYRDYTADYIASTSFQVLDENDNICQRDAEHNGLVEMDDWFTASSISYLSGGIKITSRAFAHPQDAIILSFKVTGALDSYSYRFRARLPRRMITDRTITMEHQALTKDTALFTWSNGISLAIGSYTGDATVAMDNMGLVMNGDFRTRHGPGLIVIISAAQSGDKALEQLKSIQNEAALYANTARWWGWLEEGIVPDFSDEALLAAYHHNLYAALASNLNGQIPADLTGQFRTHNMPQLYPRDALMCARVFLLTGHLEEARQVLEFWADPKIPMKSPGEWYARYDAHGQAVDAGSGARYDEPEWDSNGYFIQLTDDYHEKTREWPVDPTFVFQLADFLVEHIDETGLLYEGGIVEWTGYLPATNMIAAAALKTVSRIAGDLGDSQRENQYLTASERISASLGQMFDEQRGTYADVRFAGRKGADNRSLAEVAGDKLYLWDTSANFGILWGYPDHQEMRRSNDFYAQHCVKQDGGMQYFDAPDPGLSGYGHDLFFFTTAAAAQYHARFGDPTRAKMYIDWMLENANVYGLMPERIYLNGSGCSRASPLSWCCAEFAAALLEWQRVSGR